MKIVFLDFDGVLNSGMSIRADYEQGHRGMARIAPAHVAVLNDFLRRSGVDVVVSSTWRLNHRIGQLKDVLCAAGFVGTVLDSTPHLPGAERGHEIQKWLDETHHDVESFVIFDDDSDMAHLRDRLVWVDFQDGLQPEHVEQALALLGATAKPDALYPRHGNSPRRTP